MIPGGRDWGCLVCGVSGEGMLVVHAGIYYYAEAVQYAESLHCAEALRYAKALWHFCHG